MLTLKVDAVNKKGTGFVSGDVWYNASKNSNLDFSNLSKGMTVEIDADDNWVKSLKVLGNGNGNGISSAHSQTNKDGQIARAVAVKAIMEGALFSENHKDLAFEDSYKVAKEAIIDLEQYLLTGSFPSDKVK